YQLSIFFPKARIYIKPAFGRSTNHTFQNLRFASVIYQLSIFFPKARIYIKPAFGRSTNHTFQNLRFAS
ncbi:hypothetical protein VS883_29055, partial [Escherichia coli]